MKKKKYLAGGMTPQSLGADTLQKGLMQLIDVLSNNPNAISDQPIIGATTARTMVSPYANGGQVGVEQEELEEFAAMQGLTVDDLIAQLGLNGEEEYEEGEEQVEYKYGGKAYAYGGKANIEVEDDEVLETPNGKIFKAKGKKHEQGGIDVNVPEGTKIFSDRLKVDGKTMQERKLAREKRLAKLDKLINKNPQDKLLRASLKRTTENTSLEENRDMAIQKVADKIYNSPKFAVGGIAGDPEGYYDENGIYHPPDISNKYAGVRKAVNTDPLNADTLESDVNHFPVYTGPAYTGTVPNVGITGAKGVGRPMPIPVQTGTGVGVGDAIGLAGNAFNAVAPILNTIANRKATKPNINRFRGFGRRAIQANDQAQGYVAGIRSNAMSDIDTSANSSYVRNRNSASSLGVLRALDSTTDIARGKAKNTAESAFSREMMQILGQRSGLENEKDLREMSGETSRDLEEKGDTDNYHSNMAANLVNAGVNIQGLGKNINKVAENDDNVELLSMLSKNGITVKRVNGKLKLVNI